MPERFPSIRGGLRHVLVLAALAVLIAFRATAIWGVVHRFDGFGGSTPAPLASDDCPTSTTPSVDTISRARLAVLRGDLHRLVWFERGLLPYERGTISSSAAWTDEEPGVQVSLPSGALVTGSYEMRWWMASGDDVVADGMVFASESEARRYFAQASTGRCRPASTTHPAAYPRGGRNLEWRNPDGFVQQDLFLLRGRRVFRISVVKAGAGAHPRAAVRDEAFLLVDSLACGLPGVTCPVRLPGSAIPA